MATSLLPDTYDLNARLKPALFALLPVLLLVAIWLPKVWTVAGGLLTLVTTCGLTYLLANFARSFGQRVQTRLEGDGGRPSTVFLRHRDTHLSPESKARYHAAFRTAGLSIPTEAQEAADPSKADGQYAAAANWLREQTRSAPLLLQENIQYGFRRNLRGLRPFAVVVLFLALAGDVTALLLHMGDETQKWAGVGLLAALFLDGLAWMFLITDRFVDEQGRNYARQLLAQCDALPRSKR